MLAKRLVSKLDIKGPNLVKGIHLEGLRVLGLPENFAMNYYENGIDEIIFQDVVASLYGRNSLLDIISKTAKQIFVPLTVAGGIRSIDDIKNVLRSGADKVAINTAVVDNPELINKAANTFGSSTITIAMEVIKINDEYKVYVNNGREETGKKLTDWIIEVQERGAGEIFLTSVDYEGTGNGYDVHLLDRIKNLVKIPLIFHGGASNISHLASILERKEVDGASCSSMLHYGYLNSIKDIKTKIDSGNTEFISKNNHFHKFGNINISKIKKDLYRHGCKIRV